MSIGFSALSKEETSTIVNEMFPYLLRKYCS